MAHHLPRYPPADVQGVQPRYDHSSLLATSGGPADSDSDANPPWTRYDSIVLIHAVCGIIAWQIIAPLAVTLVAIGKRKGWWFRVHWQLQLFLVAPLTVAGVILGTVANMLGPNSGALTKHKLAGFLILLFMWIQIALGYWSRLQREHEVAFTPTADLYTSPKRRTSNYAHIVLGLGLLTISGLQVTWGFGEYTARPIPHWATAIHWTLAGLPLLIFLPILITRIVVRMRSGESFLTATGLFSSPSSPSSIVRRSTQGPPPRELRLGNSQYMEERRQVAVEEGEGEGFSYARGLQRVSTTSTWDGPETREEYEVAVRSTDGHSVADREEREEEGEASNLLAPITIAPLRWSRSLRRAAGSEVSGTDTPTRSETYNASRPVSVDSLLDSPSVSSSNNAFTFFPPPPPPPSSDTELKRQSSATPSIALRLPVPTLSLSVYPAAKTIAMNLTSPITSHVASISGFIHSQTTLGSNPSPQFNVLPLPGEEDEKSDVGSTAARENSGGDHLVQVQVQSPMALTEVQSPISMPEVEEAPVEEVVEGVSSEKASESEVAPNKYEVNEEDENTKKGEKSAEAEAAEREAEEDEAALDETAPLTPLPEGDNGDTMSLKSAGTGKWFSGRVR